MKFLESRTGEVLREKEFDRGFYSSPVAVDGRVYMTDLSGFTQVFELDDEFEPFDRMSIELAQ